MSRIRRDPSSRGKKAADRFYRRASPHAGEHSFQIVVEQSDLWITVRDDCPADLESIALAQVNSIRSQIRAWMELEPLFGPSLTPVPVPAHAPEVIRRMSEAAALMHVGPMATVAGAVAELTARELVRFSPDCLVENGGDLMLHSTRDRAISLLSEPSVGTGFGLLVKKEEFPLSICASSASIGHSLSLGQGDLAVVKARDAFVADAAATAFCNRLHRPEDVGAVAEYAAAFAYAGIQGVFLQCCGQIGVWGNMELTTL